MQLQLVKPHQCKAISIIKDEQLPGKRGYQFHGITKISSGHWDRIYTYLKNSEIQEVSEVRKESDDKLFIDI